MLAPRSLATSGVPSTDRPSTPQTYTSYPARFSGSIGIRSMTDPTAISSLRAGSRTTMLRVRTTWGARCPPGPRSSMGGREPPKIPPPSGLARMVAPDPVIGMCWPKRGRRKRGRNDGALGRRSLTPLAIPNAIFLLRPGSGSARVNRRMFWTGLDGLACVADHRAECKRTSKNTKNDVLGRVRQGRFMPGKASVTRAVRIEKDADERLRHLAEQGDTSVNTLVNRALRKFVEWDAYGEKFGFLTLPSAMLVKLMDCLTDEEARELGVWAGKNLVKEYITFWFKEVTPETLLEGFPRLLAKYGRAF